uniref:EF-hand domain-containing protein n=1 Tax=Florenciella parvula TaxID=236787 RepID=A0A7S2BT16_9STRA|mmetsp:Transcript_20210/g.42596  ORF Transcript_20210/g.42596 Transcript_20210/m.42596 type:complete len:777 (+) Transcript_20210:127-2457(+)
MPTYTEIDMEKERLKVRVLKEMLAAKELELQREKENVNALRWELMMVQGMGESAQKTIIEAVSSKVSEKLGTGLMATPDDPTWGDAEERGMTLAPIFMQNFGDFDSFSEECKSKAGGTDTPVTVDIVAQLVVDKAPGLRKDYIKSAIQLLKTPGTGADGADALDVEALYKECRKPEYLGSVLRSMFSASGSKVAIAPTEAEGAAPADDTPADEAPADETPAEEAPKNEPAEAAAEEEEEEEEHLEETKDEGKTPDAGGEVDEAAAVEAQKDALAATTGEDKSAEEGDAGPEKLVYDVLTKEDIKQLGDAFNGEKVKKDAGGKINKAEFKKLVQKIYKENSEPAPKAKDLDAAFVQADEDNSKSVDYEEFKKLFAKVKKGEVDGLGGPSMFEKAKEAGKKRLEARARAKEAAQKAIEEHEKHLAEIARDDWKPEELVEGVLTPPEVTTLKTFWDMKLDELNEAAIAAAIKAAKPKTDEEKAAAKTDAEAKQNEPENKVTELPEAEFSKVMLAICKANGETPPPKAKDLKAAFKEADADASKKVDYDEFIKLYAKVKKGEVQGLGGPSALATAMAGAKQRLEERRAKLEAAKKEKEEAEKKVEEDHAAAVKAAEEAGEVPPPHPNAKAAKPKKGGCCGGPKDVAEPPLPDEPDPSDTVAAEGGEAKPAEAGDVADAAAADDASDQGPVEESKGDEPADAAGSEGGEGKNGESKADAGSEEKQAEEGKGDEGKSEEGKGGEGKSEEGKGEEGKEAATEEKKDEANPDASLEADVETETL